MQCARHCRSRESWCARGLRGLHGVRHRCGVAGRRARVSRPLPFSWPTPSRIETTTRSGRWLTRPSTKSSPPWWPTPVEPAVARPRCVPRLRVPEDLRPSRHDAPGATTRSRPVRRGRRQGPAVPLCDIRLASQVSGCPIEGAIRPQRDIRSRFGPSGCPVVAGRRGGGAAGGATGRRRGGPPGAARRLGDPAQPGTPAAARRLGTPPSPGRRLWPAGSAIPARQATVAGPLAETPGAT